MDTNILDKTVLENSLLYSSVAEFSENSESSSTRDLRDGFRGKIVSKANPYHTRDRAK